MEAVNTVRIPPRSYHNCEVKSIDTSNNLAEVEIPSPDGQRMLVSYQGNIPLAVNDVVRIWVSDDYQIGWIDGEQPNAPADPKTSDLYDTALTNVIANIDANDIFQLVGKINLETDNFNMLMLESNTAAATHDFAFSDLGAGFNLTDHFGLFYIAVAHLEASLNDVAVAAGIYLKPRGASASATEISQLKGSGVTTFSTAVSGNNLRVTCDSDLKAKLFTVGLGGF